MPKSVRKFFSDLMLPEMGSLWLFLVLMVIVLFIDYFSFPVSWLVKPVAFLVLGVLILWNNLKTARSKEEIKNSSGRLNDVVANLSDGIIAYDTSFKVLVVNKAAQKLFNVKQEDVLGQLFGPERVRDSKFKIITQALFPSLAPLVVKRSEGEDYPQIVDISLNDPDMDLRITTIRTLSPDGRVNGFVKIIHDVTREHELIKSKSEFITVAAHQLRTPLTGLNWTLDILSKSPALIGEDKEIAQNGLAASVRGLKIVNDLLDVSKIEEGRFGYNFEEVDIIKFLGEILDSANLSAKEYGLKIFFDKGPEPQLMLKADINRLGLAVSNILDNAMRYNVENGSITVKVERLTDKPYIQISVSDTGVGVPPEAMSKIFTKFFRAENAIRFRPDGSGFGLYITKNIINRHGGSIWLESALGRNTTVYFTLPTDPTLIPPKEVVYEE